MAEEGIISRPNDPAGTGHATLARPDDSMRKKNARVSYKPYVDDDNEPMNRISRTIKADVDKNQILSVTTSFSISKASKMMLASKSKAGVLPKGMWQGRPDTLKSASGSEPVRQVTVKPKYPLMSPTATSAVDTEPRKRKSSKSGAIKNGPTVRFSDLDVGQTSKPNGKSSKEILKGETSGMTINGVQAELLYAARPSKAQDSKPKKLSRSSKSRDSKTKKPSRSSKSRDSETRKLSLSSKARGSKAKKPSRSSKSRSSKTKKPSRSSKARDSKTKKPSRSSIETSKAKIPKKREKKTVFVQVIYYRFRQIDTVAETFDAEIIINAKWPEPEFDNVKNVRERLLKEDEYNWSPCIYIENNVIVPKILSRSMTLQCDPYGGKAFVVESTKLFGKFSEPMRMSDFPFDNQNMSLTIRSEKPPSEVHLTFGSDDPHLIRKSLYFQEQQFRLYMHVVSEDLSDEQYDEYGDPKTSDELKVRCVIARSPAFYVINGYLMALILSILGFWTFAPDAKYTLQRCALGFLTMIAGITHKFTVLKEIPKTTVKTHIGYYCLFTIIYLNLLSIWHALMTFVETIAERNAWDLTGVMIFGAILILFNAWTWASCLTKSKKRRDKLAKAEKKYIDKLKSLKEKRDSIDELITD